MDELGGLLAMAGASSECSSGCQSSGWTTYLDDHSSSSSRSSCGTARFSGKAAQQPYPYYYGHYHSEEEDDQSMISDASSGPRQQQWFGGNDDVEAGAAAAPATDAPERRGRRVHATSSARRQSKKAAAAAAASLLEDTASSPAFFGYSEATRLSGDANGYGYADEPMMDIIGNAAGDFSCAFSATTGFQSPFNGTHLDGYLQMQFSSAAAAKPMATRQACRDVGETKRW